MNGDRESLLELPWKLIVLPVMFMVRVSFGKLYWVMFKRVKLKRLSIRFFNKVNVFKKSSKELSKSKTTFLRRGNLNVDRCEFLL